MLTPPVEHIAGHDTITKAGKGTPLQGSVEAPRGAPLTKVPKLPARAPYGALGRIMNSSTLIVYHDDAGFLLCRQMISMVCVPSGMMPVE